MYLAKAKGYPGCMKSNSIKERKTSMQNPGET